MKMFMVLVLSDLSMVLLLALLALFFHASGSTPSEERSTCEECLGSHYSMSGVDGCFPCNLPLVLVDNKCVSGQ